MPRPGLLRVALLAIVCAGVGLAAHAPPDADSMVAPSTREMASLLAERAPAVDPLKLWFNVNAKRAELFQAQIPLARTRSESIQARTAYARELLYAGRYADALDAVGELLADIDKDASSVGGDEYIGLLMLQATTNLRMGEEQNCAEHHNADSCLLPIRGRGVHQQQAGSMRAVGTLERILRLDPGNLSARWLLNIAHMTLGSYPDGVPPAALIPPRAFAADAAMTPFTNIASHVGLEIYGRSGGVVLEDLDRDGLLDLMVSAIGFQDQLRLFHNDGGRFSERTAASGLLGETGGLNLIHADFDNDGLPDVLVLRGGWMMQEGKFPMSLLKNVGQMRFVDVTRAAGLLGHAAPTQTATWLDYDGDGWIDLFVGNESMPDDLHPCELFHNNHDGTFSEVAKAAGVDVVGYVKGVVSGDYDNDGRPDLYLSIARARNILLHNDGPQPTGGWRFSNVSAKPIDSFPAMFFDYDNDGWLDLFVSSYQSGVDGVAADYLGLDTRAERPRLYHNAHDGTFRDVTKAAGLYKVMPGMGLNYGDLDNDGWLDIYVGTGDPEFRTLVPNRMFRNDRGRRFQEVTTSGNFGHLQKGHAIAFGDIDNDGDEDIFEQMGGAYESDRAFSVLYQNPGSAHRAIVLDLEGTTSNRGAIGARVKLVAQTPAGPRTVYRTVGPGGSFGSQTLRQEIGLGSATRVTLVEVRWPGSGLVQTFRGLKPGEHYRLREGSTAVR
jgi:hypothetical protein